MHESFAQPKRQHPRLPSWWPPAILRPVSQVFIIAAPNIPVNISVGTGNQTVTVGQSCTGAPSSLYTIPTLEQIVGILNQPSPSSTPTAMLTAVHPTAHLVSSKPSCGICESHNAESVPTAAEYSMCRTCATQTYLHITGRVFALKPRLQAVMKR